MYMHVRVLECTMKLLNLLIFIIIPELGNAGNIICEHGHAQKNNTCSCFKGYTGPQCSIDIDECKLNICSHNNTSNCSNTDGGFNCTCKYGWEGPTCAVDSDDCYPNKCKNKATCIDKVGWYKCNCKPGFIGKNCGKHCPKCPKHSKCIEKNNTAICHCDDGREGKDCKDIDECHLYRYLCKHGNCTNEKGKGKWHCNCFPSWTGRQCDKKEDYCKHNPCKHGQCLSQEFRAYCKCEPNYNGTYCDQLINPCDKVKCLNGGTCKNISATEFKCNCLPGFTGKTCETVLPCYWHPCKNKATCKNLDVGYNCTCKSGWTGQNCSKISACRNNPCENGAECTDVGDDFKCICITGYTGKRCEKGKKKCLIPECKTHLVGQHCRAKCNNLACDWDGTDCSLGVNPWMNCTETSKCSKVFSDGHCNQECNNDACLFDGRDCEGKKVCKDEAYCKLHFENEKCDSKCNNAECVFDGMDCNKEASPKIVPGELIVKIIANTEEFEKLKKNFIRSMSVLLNSHVIIDKVIVITDRDGQEIRRRRGVDQRKLEVQMKLDNQKCTKDCFQTTKSAAKYIAAKKVKRQLSNLPFKVYAVDSIPPKHTVLPGSISPLWIASCVAVPLLLLGVIAFTRKVVARLWHPEGDNRFAVNDMRREPLGQEGDEMTNLQRRESVSGGSHVSPSGSCSDSPNSVGDAKRMKVEMVGSLGSNDWLNVKGVLRGQCDVANSVVHLPAGSPASPSDSCGDTGGETNLHVAARLAKTDLARQLIEFGVDINARNKSGKTPLHLAIPSLADGVFELLIRNRACQIDVQDYEGRTGLMNACHCCHNMMVDEMISNGAKVNLVDSQGKTALHCAAMVDNHKAVLVLLKNGAKVDSQDNKGQTPLFLAARDGAYTTAYVLLANYANRNCADSMDVTPLTISHQRGQKDLVALLSDWTGSSPGMMTSPRNSPPDLSSPSSGTISPTPGAQYSDIRPKLPNNYIQLSNGNCNPTKPPMKRKRKNKSQKEKPLTTEKNHPSFLNNYPTNISDVYPTPRSSMDKRESGLPDLNNADILDTIYPQMDQINSLPTNWNNSIMGGGGHGHFQYNNSMFLTSRQFAFQQQRCYNPNEIISGRTFPTPPSGGVESPNGSPIDPINVLPSPFLTPSPDTTWSNSPGNSDNSG